MGASPIFCSIYRELAQFGRALDLGSRGHRFKSCIPDHYARLSKQVDEQVLETCAPCVRVRVPHLAPYAQLGTETALTRI